MKKLRISFSLLLVLSLTAGVRAEDPDGGWPRLVTSEAGSKILMHQPQIESWTDQQLLDAWAAVEYLGSNQSKSVMGVIEITANTSVSKEERLVKLDKIQIKQVNFPRLSHTQAREVTTAISSRFPKDGMMLALDRILAAVDKSAIRSGGVAINQQPPPIFYSKYPAILVQFDGEPIISPIKDCLLKFIVNTNWDVLLDPETGTYYLRNGKNWFSSKEIDHSWEPVRKLPKSFQSLPKDDNWKDVRENMPPKNSGAIQVFVSRRPAELIVTKGKPKLERVEKSKLYWVKNTEADLFHMKKGAYYYLVAGRWFKADKLEGPWVFATTDLPKEFLDFPRDHERSRVRSAVPGTDEAAEAVLLAQIPSTLRVETKDADSPKVTYLGEPKFEAIKGTKVTYATNCSNDVLKVGDLYYLCFQGAWFRSAKADGPWDLAKSVPDEIYKIPSDCPVHHVTYVKVGSVDAESITYVQTSGYSGVTVSFGVAMWGTGWYYPPYYGYGGYYPVYYPYPCSYGGNAIYNPRTGAYGYGSTVAGPNGGISRAATYNPNTGTYARGSAAWGPSGAKGQLNAYNPRTGTSLSSTQNRNSQGSWGTTKVSRGDNWAQSGHVKTDAGSVSGIRTSKGDGAIRASGENGSGFVGTKDGDIYAGKDGNVYRKTEDGWQQHTDDGWSDVDRGEPKASTRDKATTGDRASTKDQVSSRDRAGSGASAGTRDQLNRDAGARASGNDRTRDYSSQNRSSNRSGGSYSGSRGSSGSGSYGGSRSGGGMRGGGGGRRR